MQGLPRWWYSREPDTPFWRNEVPHKRTILSACPVCGGDVFSAPKRTYTYCSLSCKMRAHPIRPQPRLPIADLFWPRIEKSPTCWIATGAMHEFGYGKMGIILPDGTYKTEVMHRVAWWLATGDWPAKGRFVCHNCPGRDNPACVRNDEIGVYVVDGVEYERRGHLWLGTAKANTRDMMAKGRSGLRPHVT